MEFGVLFNLIYTFSRHRRGRDQHFSGAFVCVGAIASISNSIVVVNASYLRDDDVIIRRYHN